MDNSKNFRASIQNLFNVRCVFPANDRTWSKDEALFVARCMKEKTDNTNLKEFIEDIVTRLRTVSENGEERHSVIEALKYLSKNVFGNSPILELNHQNANPVISFEKGNLSHAGIARALQLVVSDQTIGIIHTFAKHSLLSVSRFHSNTTLASGMLANTTGIGCKDLRLRFIVYQLFQAVKFIHSKGLCLESINPCDIMLDDEMWVHVPMGLSERLLFCAEAQVKNKELKRFFMKQKRLRLQQEAEENNSNNQLVSMKTSVPRPIDYNEPLTIQWISGKISNFEYLMAINVAAGRTMMDPLYHPILPWVTDFTTNCLDILQPPSYRDLSKTKFRLSKGDTQLETTFRHSDPPHHIPESLSELTYYIYLARRTPMQVLRRVVRDVFVPEHYPQSMHRIYEWTPDECIPEFYMDSTVFSSIHKNYGFPDLEVPEFTNNSADEFIRYHRQVLESDYVSNNLHLWIDLTFGYCLEGQAAIDQMNVPLHHTLSSNERLGLDSPNVNKNPGFVMLFDSPHPVREISRKPLQSHIYSFDNSSDVDEEFKQLNAIYTEETNKKYQVKPLYLGQRHDLQGMEDYCALDRDSPMTKAFRMMNANAARDSIVNNNKGMNNNLGDSQMQSMGESIAYRKSRKSLIRPLADATWNKFRYLEDINLGKADQRGQEAANNLFLQTDHYKFADKTTAFIDSTYSIPSTGRIKKPEKAEDKASTISGAKETKKVTDSDFFAHSLSKNVSNSLWDYEFISSTLLSEELLSLDHQMKNQFHQAITLKSVKGKNEENDEDDELSEEIKAEIEELQSDDMFGLGCMIAELYNGRSLLSKNDTVAMTLGTSFQETLQKIYKRTLGMPLVLQRLISLLTHPNHKLRPRAQEILETCIIINAENSSIPPEDYITKNNEISSKTIYELKESNSIERFTRIQLVSEFIHSLFPDYFHSIYSIVSALKLSSNGLLRLNTLLNSIEEISLLPIDGLNLGLVHFLDVIADSEFFTNNLQDSYDVEVLDVKTILSNYWRIIDVLGLRLGLEGTERLVVPHVVKFLNSFTAIDLLRDLLHSSLFNILALRSGVKCFLKNFLPILLTYLSAGTLHHVLLRKSYYETPGWVPENLPLWTNATAKISEKDEWLKKSSIASIHRVQRSAVTAISNLSEVDALGSGICARYIIPSLLSLVGVPHLASTGFEPRKPFSEENSSSNSNSFSLPVNPLGNNAAISELSEKIFDELVQQSLIWARRTLQDQDRPNFFEISRNPDEEDELQSSENNNNHSIPEKLSQMWANDRGLLESYIMKRATFNAEHMYCVKVIVEMGTKLGDVVISELILSNIVNIILPELESNLTAVPKQGTAAALMEIILLLNGLLPILSAETIHHDLLQPSRLSGSCIPRLLSIWPLVPAFSFLDENLSEELTGQFNILYSIENVRLHSVLLELCRLIVSMSMIVGAELTSDFVLPHLDNFFKNFVNTYGIFPVESKTMLKAFELGAEIYLPLVQIVSAEAFYTAVPNLNPRLELWLRGIGSNIPPTSPPLPANIWPEVTSEVAARPEKKKSWFPTWLRGYNSSSSSSSGTNNNNNNSAGNGPNVAATPATIIQPGNPLPAPNNPTPNTNSKQSGPFTVLPSLLKGKSQQPPQPDEYELRESDTLMGGDSNATPFRSKKGPFRTPSVIAPGQSNPFSPTNGTELVDMGTNLNADLARAASSLPAASIASSASIVSTSLESSSITTGEHSNTATNSSSNNPATSTNKRPPSIGRSVLSLDEGQIQQSTPFRRRKRAGTAGTEESEPVAEDDRPSGDSDDDEYEEEEDGGPALATDTSVILNDELESKAADGTTQDELLQEELHQKHSLVAVSPEQSPSLGATDRKTIDSDPLGAARNSFPKPQTPDNTKNSHELGPLPIDTDLPKPPSFPPIIDGNNSIVSATPRVLFSPEASDSNRSMKIERKTLDDSKNPFRRYQRLLNNRLIHNKSNRYSGYAQSPLKLRNLSVAHTAPPSNKRNSLSKMSSSSSSASAANNPNTNLSSNSNYLIINSQPPENETMDEIEFRESRYSELAWLLAGSGRWNVDKEMKDRLNKEQTKIMKGYKSTISYYNSNTEWNPAAQMSMTAPKIAVDVANDSCSLINFQLQANTQWKLEEPPGLIRCMVTNPNETLLMTCSRSGVRLFSLSTHPILHVSSYTNHSNPPFNAAFLRDGLHAMTCDGSIHLWDIETRQALGIIIPVDKQTGYSFASVIPSKYGIHATMDAVGDEQILATLADTVSYFDLRCNHTKPMNRVGEWILPQIPPPQGNFISATMEPLQLTCAYSSDNYVFAGSQTGGIYVLERRMGKLLNSWQAHDGPILKLNTLSERHILAVSDRSAAVWEYIPEVSHTTYPISSLYPGTFSQPAYNNSIHNTPVAYHEFRDINTVATMSGTNPNLTNISLSMYHMGYGGIGDVKKLLNIKNSADAMYSMNNIFLSSFENNFFVGNNGLGSGGSGHHHHHHSNNPSISSNPYYAQQYAKYAGIIETPSTSSRDNNNNSNYNSNLSSSKTQKVLYCLAGHRMHSGFLPNLPEMTNNPTPAATPINKRFNKEAPECDELRLSTLHFMDRKGSKLTKSKLQITSSVLLPLRRLLLIASEDGFVRVIS